jgi:hypothetical protein
MTHLNMLFLALLLSTALTAQSALASISPSKWNGYLDVLGFPGADGTVQRTDLFIPWLQGPDTLSYVNLRSNVDEEGFSGFSVGFGLRHRVENVVLGTYGFYGNHEPPDSTPN